MKMQDLMSAREYDAIIVDSRRQLEANPEDRAAVAWMASAFQAKGDYRHAIDWLERLDLLRSKDKQFNVMAPGHPGSRIRIACLRWLLGERAAAISGMHGAAAGILDRTIKYADSAGGMTQGLLLYYMAVTAKIPAESSYALDYLRRQVESLKKRMGERLSSRWPCPVAHYLLGDVVFEFVIKEVEREDVTLAVPDAAARLEIGRRNRLLLAMFYDGVKSRVEGNEAHFLDRMREVYLLENTSLEWFLARHEIEQTGWADNITL
jgi:hypothetical protein